MGRKPGPPRCPWARRLAWTLAALLGAPGLAAAHPVPFSYLDLRISATALEGSLVAHVFDLGWELGIEPGERLLDPALASARAGGIADLYERRLSILVDGRPVLARWSEPEVVADRQAVRLRFRTALRSPTGRMAVQAVLFPYDPNHKTFLNVYEGDALTQAILDRARPRFEFYAGTRQGRYALIERFLRAGVEHILIGPDHLLFLAGLLLLGGSARRLALIVTAFTVAHSVTLSLAALDLFRPPAHVIEPLIALSIVYVGADNLLRRGGRDTRAWIAFAFGFVHGFGFSYVLREMDLPARALGWSLLSFNGGVEVGQLLVVLILASVLALIRARSEAAGRRIAVIGSVAVMAAGAFWYIERVFFPGGYS